MKTRAHPVPMAVALFAMACDSPGGVSFYDKELEPLESAESIGRVGDVDLVVRVRFSYKRYDALSGKVHLLPHDGFHGSVDLEEVGAERTRCATTTGMEVEHEWRGRCALFGRSAENESSWRAAYESVEIESCVEGSRAAIRATMDGNAFPSAGWYVVDTTGEDVEWIESHTENDCTEALATPSPPRPPEAPPGPDRPDDYKIAPY
jgi:hypothetical protein